MIMKRIFVFVVLSVLSSACTVDYGNDCRRTSGNLESIGKSLVDMSAVYAVNWLYEAVMERPAINQEGTSVSSSAEYDSGLVVDYRFSRIADNVWKVEISSLERLSGSLQVSMEVPDADHGDVWRVSPFVLDYSEGDGYSARLTAEYGIDFEWDYSGDSLPAWSLVQSGIYYLETFIGDDAGDAAQLQYSKGNFLFSGGPGY